MRTWVRTVLLVCVIVAGSALVFHSRIGDPLPAIGDEYSHISYAKQLLSEGALPYVNPYFISDTPHQNFESGFHYLLAAIFLFVGDEPEFFYPYLAMIAFAVNALLLFHLVRLLTGDWWAALFSVVFFSTITSTNSVLAFEFFLPLSVGIGLLLTAFIVFARLVERPTRKHAVLLALACAALAFFYPPALFFFLCVAFLYVLLAEHTLHETCGLTRKRFSILLLSCVSVGAILFVILLHSVALLDKVFFTAAWDIVHTRVSPIFYFGVIPSALAVVGVVATALDERAHAKLLLYWFVFGIAAIFAFYFTGMVFLVPFPRLFIFHLIGVAILAGIGTAVLVRLLRGTVGRFYGSIMALVIVTALVFLQYQYAIEHEYTYPDLITDEQHEALMFLKENTRIGVVIADSLTSRVVYPLTGHHVVGLMSANVGGGDPAAAQRFLSGNCEEKIVALEELREYTGRLTSDLSHPLYVYAHDRQSCTFLEPLYETGPFIYSVVQKDLRAHRMTLYRDMLSAPEEARTPDTETLSGESLRAFLSDTTITADAWTEYFSADGMIWGRSEGRYVGYWSVDDSFYCYYYPRSKEHGCRALSVTGDTVTLYDETGSETVNVQFIPGNSFAL